MTDDRCCGAFRSVRVCCRPASLVSLLSLNFSLSMLLYNKYSLLVIIKVIRHGCSGQLSFPFWYLRSSLIVPLPMNPLFCLTPMPITGDAKL